MAADPLFKPNGLWYADGDEWLTWCNSNQAEQFTHYKYSYELNIDFSRMCVLETLESVLEFHWKYSYKYSDTLKAIDWKKVRDDYSGIEVRNYETLYWSSSMRGIIWPRNWTVSSGCVWDLSTVSWSTAQPLEQTRM
jgi:hypothetical protein